MTGGKKICKYTGAGDGRSAHLEVGRYGRQAGSFSERVVPHRQEPFPWDVDRRNGGSHGRPSRPGLAGAMGVEMVAEDVLFGIQTITKQTTSTRTTVQKLLGQSSRSTPLDCLQRILVIEPVDTIVSLPGGWR